MLFNVLKVDINSKNVDGNTCVHHCAEIGSDSRLRWLLAAGADTEIANNLGETPLLTAVRHNFSKCVYSLLAAGADVHAKRDDGLSVLQLALQPVFRSALAQEIVWTLLAVGAQARWL
jgi:ankyrin repeat protein